MELVFIRHGEGEHTGNIPESLHLPDPSLTPSGKQQAKILQEQLPLHAEDIMIISPTRRTLETACIWSENYNCRRIVSPLVAPRIFPYRPNARTLPCDRLLTIKQIKHDFPIIEMDETFPGDTIWRDGINTISEESFKRKARTFLTYCQNITRKQIYIVSHDGTITAYRQMISGELLTREDFPKETQVISISLENATE
ncbi:phosphoglycerate mutase family protein [Caldibacillus lycopersici]|uniref:Phosphoglycerate mutase family protein n=1 Tax=Perspicuibacillus lycopersici TaxID=1325689 RepID=A0AAE3LRM6_9BACI|nr:histidine phosphatase family protein [Perspicuibacillus lycopersici]MCU9614829.1 phosphoglycerate mutase family protein [Perspicuibacillus lycopersici]